MRHLLRGLLLVAWLILPAQARPVTLNDQLKAVKQASVVLVDLPEDGGRDRALAYIREMQGYLFERLEFVDVRLTPREDWEPRLEKGFVLYGTFASGSVTSEVLAHTYGGMTYAPGRLETPVFRGEAPELRLITVGRNPFGKGPVVVFAAERTEMLVGINDAYHGPQGYHLFTRNKILREGSLREGR